MTTAMDKRAEAIRDQISVLMNSFKIPNFDISALIETQRHNIEAMSKAAQLTTKAATNISHRQLAMFRVASEQLTKTWTSSSRTISDERLP